MSLGQRRWEEMMAWREIKIQDRVRIVRDRPYLFRHPTEDRAVRVGDDVEVLGRGEGYILFESPDGWVCVDGGKLRDRGLLLDEDFVRMPAESDPTCKCVSLLFGHESGCPFAAGVSGRGVGG